MNDYFVYILTNRRNGTLYIGVTNDMERRILEHREGTVDSYTKEHRISMLVYLERTNDISAALDREKQLKNWKRDWKERLIESANPEWHDLSKT